MSYATVTHAVLQVLFFLVGAWVKPIGGWVCFKTTWRSCLGENQNLLVTLGRFLSVAALLVLFALHVSPIDLGVSNAAIFSAHEGVFQIYAVGYSVVWAFPLLQLPLPLPGLHHVVVRHRAAVDDARAARDDGPVLALLGGDHCDEVVVRVLPRHQAPCAAHHCAVGGELPLLGDGTYRLSAVHLVARRLRGAPRLPRLGAAPDPGHAAQCRAHSALVGRHARLLHDHALGHLDAARPLHEDRQPQVVAARGEHLLQHAAAVCGQVPVTSDEARLDELDEAREVAEQASRTGDGWSAQGCADEWHAFATAWNALILSLRARDLLSNPERDDLVFDVLESERLRLFFGSRHYCVLPAMISSPIFTSKDNRSLVTPSTTRYAALVPVAHQLRDLLLFVLVEFGILEEETSSSREVTCHASSSSPRRSSRTTRRAIGGRQRWPSSGRPSTRCAARSPTSSPRRRLSPTIGLARCSPRIASPWGRPASAAASKVCCSHFARPSPSFSTLARRCSTIPPKRCTTA